MMFRDFRVVPTARRAAERGEAKRDQRFCHAEQESDDFLSVQLFFSVLGGRTDVVYRYETPRACRSTCGSYAQPTAGLRASTSTTWSFAA